MRLHLKICLLTLGLAAACSRFEEVGKAPDFTPVQNSDEYHAMISQPLPVSLEPAQPLDRASLWSGERGSLLGDRRAIQQGDIMTVVIEINDKAEISNSTNRNRSGSESLAIPQLFGIPQRVDPNLPEGASLANAVSTTSSSASAGDGSVKRNEKLTLRVAATITGVLPNGVLQIVGRQEVRVNFEMRELLVTGYCARKIFRARMKSRTTKSLRREFPMAVGGRSPMCNSPVSANRSPISSCRSSSGHRYDRETVSRSFGPAGTWRWRRRRHRAAARARTGDNG